MSIKPAFAVVAALALATPAFAKSIISIEDSYVLSAMMNARSGAAFMKIVNSGDEDDRLIDARTDIARRVELHTHKESADGVMRMMHVPEGFAVPAGGEHMLQRGGDHVMLMGLTGALKQDEKVTIKLVFEKAGAIDVEIPVRLGGMAKKGMQQGHMNHNHQGMCQHGQGQMKKGQKGQQRGNYQHGQGHMKHGQQGMCQHAQGQMKKGQQGHRGNCMMMQSDEG